MERASERYKTLLELNKQVHEAGSEGFNGQSLLPVICDIGVLLRQQGCASVLDYGCGRGDAQRCFRVDFLWNVKYRGYDPAVDAFPDTVPEEAGFGFVKKLPAEKFDAVVCTDVLEHIPEEDLRAWVMDELFSIASKFMFIKVPTWAASKTLPNGENVHCTVRPREWWQALVSEYSSKYKIPVGLYITESPGPIHD